MDQHQEDQEDQVLEQQEREVVEGEVEDEARLGENV